MERNSQIRNLRDNLQDQWDIVVIGGGATGLGIALDAVTRGYRTLLLEQSDFAKSTSSKSTKLVHGGVRYLAQGDILLVTEALHERGIMLKNAPHLTANQEFIIPAYRMWDVILYTVGLKFYDLLAGRLSMGKSYFISGSVVHERLPHLKTDKLKGGIVYHDGQFDDSRMAIALAEASAANGGTLLNYFRVTGFLKDAARKISGVTAKDELTGDEYSIKAKLVINATGVFADEIHRMDDPGSRPTIRPSQGVHIVLDGSFLDSNSAIMIPRTDDGRVLFAIPWYGKVVAGTTDTPLNTITLEPRALDEEIEFILRTAGKYLVKAPGREDILCIYAGLRPLAADPDNPESTKEVSRRHKITLSASGLVSIVGGKWTSYRRMAEETIDRAVKAGMIEKRKCVTKTFRLFNDEAKIRSERLKIYGSGAAEIEKISDDNPEMGRQIVPDLPYTGAEIQWICRNEMPVNLEDILSRRTRALLLDVKGSMKMAPAAAEIMAKELGKDTRWQEKQLEDYKKLAENYL